MQIARILELAERLEADIQTRGLKPGDPYLGTEQTARLLGVSSHLANRAMQLLVKRGILHRRQRRGTFIAKLPGQSRPGPLARVHLLVHREYLLSEGVLVDGVVVGMEGELPGAQMVFNFIPPDGNLDTIQRLVADSLQAPVPEGFVLVRCPLPVQRLIESSGLPAVIYGQPYPSITGIPSIDYDHEQSTEMLVKYLLDQGCERMVLVLRQQVFPGDHRVLDQMQRLLTAAGLGLGDWLLRCLPQDEACVAAETVRLLKAACGRPTGFFCRSEPLADGVAAGLARLGDAAPKTVICAGHVYRRSGPAAAPRYVHTRPVLSPEEIGGRIGQKLALQARGLRPDPYQETLAMELVEPGIQQPPTHPARPWNDHSQPTQGKGAS